MSGVGKPGFQTYEYQCTLCGGRGFIEMDVTRYRLLEYTLVNTEKYSRAILRHHRVFHPECHKTLVAARLKPREMIKLMEVPTRWEWPQEEFEKQIANLWATDSGTGPVGETGRMEP
jgi:hypothetical protein